MKQKANVVAIHVFNNLKLYIIIAGVFLIGICIGSAAVNSLSDNSCAGAMDALGGAFIKISKGEANKLDVFLSSFISSLKVILLIWMAGFTTAALPLIICITGIKGFVTGFAGGLFIRLYGVKGFWLSLGGILPHYLILMPTIIFIAVAGARFSAVMPKGKLLERANRADTGGYFILLAAAVAMLILASAVDTYISAWLVSLMSHMFI